MFQIDSSTAATSIPTPDAPGPHVNGYFTNATTITADFLNAIMMEICHVITATGGTLSKTNRTQLYTAIQSMISGAGIGGLSAVVDDTSPTLGGDLNVNGHAIVNATGNITLQATGGTIALNAPTITVNQDIACSADTTTKMTFGSGTQTYYAGGTNVFDIDTDGLRLGGSGARVIMIDNDATMSANRDDCLVTQAAIVGFAADILPHPVTAFYGVTNSAFTGGNTYYFASEFVTSTAPGASDATKYLCYVVPQDCTINDLLVAANAAPGSGQSFATTVMVNGVASALTATISDTSTIASDTTHSVTLIAGDAICLRVVCCGSAGVSGFSWNLRGVAA